VVRREVKKKLSIQFSPFGIEEGSVAGWEKEEKGRTGSAILRKKKRGGAVFPVPSRGSGGKGFLIKGTM